MPVFRENDGVSEFPMLISAAVSLAYNKNIEQHYRENAMVGRVRNILPDASFAQGMDIFWKPQRAL